MTDLIVAASVAGGFVVCAALLVCIDLRSIARELRRADKSRDDHGERRP